jgi:hypothetical protein
MGRESIYWLIVLITFAYILYKYRRSSFCILIILFFYSGLAASFGKAIENPFKILLVLFSIYLLIKYKGLQQLKYRDKLLLGAFIVFSVSFLTSVTVNGGYFTLIFSQYGKYLSPILIYLIFTSIQSKRSQDILKLSFLFLSLISIQIVLSILKLILIGIHESIVGSVAYSGGGLATPVPLFGFIILWLYRRGVFKAKDWIFVFLLLIIGFASNKRAIWFIMPFFIFLFVYYIPRRISIKQLIYYIPLIPIIFYLGVRLNPFLNVEGKIGGTFNFQYTIDYIMSYSFGSSTDISEIKTGEGRASATFLLINKLFSDKPLILNDFIGYGLEEIYTVDYEQFNDIKFGLSSKGAASGVFQTYIVSGFLGIIVTIGLMLAILNLVTEKRLRYTLGLLLIWDYFFYSGLILRNQVLLIMLFYIIVLSNLIYQPLLNKANTQTDENSFYKFSKKSYQI